jgi:hypothetical protein
VITFAEAGLAIEDAARAAGASPRSVRRWRAEGEIAELSHEARVALAFERAAQNEIDWQESATFLEVQYAERWADPLGDDVGELFDDLGELNRGRARAECSDRSWRSGAGTKRGHEGLAWPRLEEARRIPA